MAERFKASGVDKAEPLPQGCLVSTTWAGQCPKADSK